MYQHNGVGATQHDILLVLISALVFLYRKWYFKPFKFSLRVPLKGGGGVSKIDLEWVKL